MKQVFKFNENHPPDFTFQWEVEYRYESPDGLWYTDSLRFVTRGKGAKQRRAVKAEFKKQFPNAEIINITVE